MALTFNFLSNSLNKSTINIDVNFPKSKLNALYFVLFSRKLLFDQIFPIKITIHFEILWFLNFPNNINCLTETYFLR